LNNRMVKVSDIRGVYDTIKMLSEAHKGVAKFDCGEENDFSVENLYPLVYLELPFLITESKQTETYKIALNVLDKITDALDLDSRISALSKCKQIAANIKLKLKEYFLEVSDGNYLTLPDTGNDVVVGVNLEFELKAPRHVSPCDDVFAL